jgi:hypothetical protein
MCILSPTVLEGQLSDILRDFKKFTARTIPEDYVYSSASNYAGMESIKVLLMDVKWKTN